MRKNRKLGKMFTIIVDMGGDKYMYSVTPERYYELLQAKDRSAFANWKGHTDYSYSFGGVVQLSDGLWYKVGKVKDKKVRLADYAEGVYFEVMGLLFQLSGKKLKGSAPVPGELSIDMEVITHGKKESAEVSVKWLSDVIRSFARYKPVPGEPGIMRLPSEALGLAKKKTGGEGMKVDHIFKYGSYDKV